LVLAIVEVGDFGRRASQWAAVREFTLGFHGLSPFLNLFSMAAWWCCSRLKPHQMYSSQLLVFF
jgi:hypothetical protein